MKTEFEKWFDSSEKQFENPIHEGTKLEAAVRYLTAKKVWDAAIDKCLDIIKSDNNIPEIIRKLNALKSHKTL